MFRHIQHSYICKVSSFGLLMGRHQTCIQDPMKENNHAIMYTFFNGFWSYWSYDGP